LVSDVGIVLQRWYSRTFNPLLEMAFPDLHRRLVRSSRSPGGVNDVSPRGNPPRARPDRHQSGRIDVKLLMNNPRRFLCSKIVSLRKMTGNEQYSHNGFLKKTV